MTEFVGIPMIHSDVIPKGTFILGALGAGVRMWEERPLRFWRDPWGPATYALTDRAEEERRRGLDHLARLLDGMCEDLGLDPDETWRDPHIRERERDEQVRATKRRARESTRSEGRVPACEWLPDGRDEEERRRQSERERGREEKGRGWRCEERWEEDEKGKRKRKSRLAVKHGELREQLLVPLLRALKTRRTKR